MKQLTILSFILVSIVLFFGGCNAHPQRTTDPAFQNADVKVLPRPSVGDLKDDRIYPNTGKVLDFVFEGQCPPDFDAEFVVLANDEAFEYGQVDKRWLTVVSIAHPQHFDLNFVEDAVFRQLRITYTKPAVKILVTEKKSHRVVLVVAFTPDGFGCINIKKYVERPIIFQQPKLPLDEI